MDNKIIISSIVCFILSLILINLASAIGSLGTVKKGECIELYQYCPSCTFVNLTAVKFPNGTISNYNYPMTKSGSNFNYTFCNTSSIGEYFYSVCGDKKGELNCENIVFEVTNLGSKQTTSQGLNSVIFLGLMIFLTMFFGYIGFKFSQSQYLWVIGLFFIFLSVIFIVYDVYLGYEYHALLTGLPDSSTPEIIFYIFLSLLTAGIFTSLALLFVHWKKIFKYIKREIKRKEDNYEDVENWEVDEWKAGNRLTGGHFQPTTRQ